MDYLLRNLAFLAGPNLSKDAQEALAKSAGVGQPAISKIIAGRTKEPGARTVAGLAKHFGVTIDDLMWRDLSVQSPARASQSTGLDAAKLADLLGTVEAAIATARVSVAPMVKARLVASLYADKEASAASSAKAVQAALASILSTMEAANHESDAAR